MSLVQLGIDGEFRSYPEILTLEQTEITVTEKLHGTNGSLHTYWDDEMKDWNLKVGSRERWITPEDDAMGLATWALSEPYRSQIMERLGPGRHYGEWVGRNIVNGGLPLPEKRFVLFSVLGYVDIPLPDRVDITSLLYRGPWDPAKIEEIMLEMKEKGSFYLPGYMRPEGIVIHIVGTDVRIKHVFNAETTQWNKSPKIQKEKKDYSHLQYLLQPIRLEKLLLKDSKFMDEYPKNLPVLTNAYWEDLIKENQVQGEDKEAVKKEANSVLFAFVRSEMEDYKAGRRIEEVVV